MKYSLTAQSDLTRSEFFGSQKYGMIVASSWEDRSRFIQEQITESLSYCINIIFENKGATGRSEKNRASIKQYCKKHSIPYKEVRFDSTNASHEKLVDTSLSIQKLIGNKLDDWIIDITSMPRRLWFSLICLMDGLDSVRRFHFFYAHPNYEMDNEEKSRNIYSYTTGEWLMEQPAFLPPRYDSGLFRFNIFSVGFEYDSLKKMFFKFETDDNRIIYSSPGYTDQYTNIAEKTIDKIKYVFEIKDEKIDKCKVNDFQAAIDSFRNQANNMSSYKDLAEKNIICAGNKIHSLALLFCRLEDPTFGLYMRIPIQYLEKNTTANGKFDLIHAENLHAPIQTS